MDILIVNINHLEYTKTLIECLQRQTVDCTIRLIDQNSSEKGTKEYFNSLDGIEVIFNKANMPLNWLWNDFYHSSNDEYLCFLNNDIVVPSNFVEDTIKIFEMEQAIGCVIHATNHPFYQEVTDLNYKILNQKIVQGWDFTMRRKVYKLIPDQIKFFGGDDFLFSEMYKDHWKTAVALSSPIIHYNGSSRSYCDALIRESDNKILRGLGCERLSYRSPYTKWKPTFNTIFERGQDNGK